LTNGGTFSFTITATNSTFGCTASSSYTMDVVCPAIVVSPAGALADTTNGTALSVSVAATNGAGPYIFTVGSGTLPAGVTLAANGLLSGTPAVGAYSFTVVAADTNGCVGSAGYTLKVLPTADTDTPKIKLLWPAAKKVAGTVGNPTLVVSGTASDKVYVYQVLVGLNGGPVTNVATLTGTGKAANWSYDWLPAPAAGSNTVVVKAVDLLGNETAPVTATFFYASYVPLTLIQTNDVGTTAGSAVTPTKWSATNGTPLVVGFSYAMKLAPTAGYLFKNIMSNDVANAVTKYSFIMQSNLVLTVNVVTNRFFDGVGTYYGLFSHADGINRTNAGFLTFKVKAKDLKAATFSGTLYVNGNKGGFSGTFGLEGLGTSKKPVDLQTKWGHGTPMVWVQLPLDGTNVTFTGSVSNGWVSEASGYRSVAVTNYAGNYTMLVKGDATNSANVPGGDGYGLVNIDTTGVIKLAGSKLADGQTLGQKVGIAQDGRWAFFSSADKGTTPGQNHSFIMGWLTVNATTGISGDVTWLKDAAGPSAYAGLGMETVVVGSPYADPAGQPIFPWVNGLVTYEGAGITLGAVTNSVTQSNVGGKNKFTAVGKLNKMTLSVTPKSGLLTVGFEYPGGTKFKGKGAVLTNTVGGSGYYLNAAGTESGQFKLEGN
jgi:hypothetical protein